MSIASEILRVKSEISNAYTAISEMGGTLPTLRNSDNLVDAIDSIHAESKIYGVHWDGTSTQVLTRTDDSASFSNPVPYVSGATSYSSPFDTISPWKDMQRLTDSECGEVVSIPKFYYYLSIGSDNSLDLKISMSKQDGYRASPAHMDRGDGKGERDIIYVGRYHCASGYKSATGVYPLDSKTRAAFRSGIHNLGDDVWQMDFATRITIWMLYLVEYANWNSQETIGYGCGNNSDTERMGSTDSMPYHTGTMQTSKTTYGVGVQYRYMEGLWENVCDWCDGVYFADTNVYGILNPANFSDSANGTLICTRPATSNYISAWQKGSDDFDWFLYPSAVGSVTNYVGDYCTYVSAGGVLLVGGDHGRSQIYGLFFLLGGYSNSLTGGNIGSRLMKLP